MRMKSNEVTRADIGGAIEVHRTMGPGLLESAYEACLEHERLERGLRCERQKPLPVVYHGVRLDCGHRIDLLVEDVVLVELKAVSRVLAIHQSQRMTYLKLSDLHVGLLLNFHVLRMRDGIHWYVRELPE
jgi:GxxExxY protein